MKQVLYFTADWCVPCKKVRPIVEEMSRENPEIGFVFIDSEIEKIWQKFSTLKVFQHLF